MYSRKEIVIFSDYLVWYKARNTEHPNESNALTVVYYPSFIHIYQPYIRPYLPTFGQDMTQGQFLSGV